MKYRTKPVVIDAVLWTGSNLGEIRDFVRSGGGGLVEAIDNEGLTQISIWNEPEQRWIRCPWQHYVIQGVAGEFCPCDPGIFDATYEPPGDES